MPKIKLDPLPPDDVPVWDALVAELGDPRPYEPVEIPPSLVVEDDAFFDVWAAHARDVVDTDRTFDDLISDLDDRDREAVAALDELWSWPETYEDDGDDARRDVEPRDQATLRLVVGDDPTVTLPALGVLDQLNNPPKKY